MFWLWFVLVFGVVAAVFLVCEWVVGVAWMFCVCGFCYCAVLRVFVVGFVGGFVFLCVSL